MQIQVPTDVADTNTKTNADKNTDINTHTNTAKNVHTCFLRRDSSFPFAILLFVFEMFLKCF